MNINKEILTRVVDSCYSSSYKIFTVNSHDGFSITRPLGLFISLGMTTSFKTMEIVVKEVRDQLKVNVELAEIASRLVDNHYVNSVIRVGRDVAQYESGSVTNGLRLTKDELKDFILDTKSKIVKNIDDDRKVTELTNRLTKMMKVLDKVERPNQVINLIDNGSEFDVYVVNDRINYAQYQEMIKDTSITVHKRIGILVNFN